MFLIFLDLHYFIRLKYRLVLNFVVFVVDDPHFDKMFKMVLIFAFRVLFGHFL